MGRSTSDTVSVGERSSWVARNLERGLTRVRAESLIVPGSDWQDSWLVETDRESSIDGELPGKRPRPGPDENGGHRDGESCLPQSRGRLLSELDRVLEEVRLLGRRGAVVHVQSARFGSELIVLVDEDPEYDWVLPAVRQRIIDAAAKAGCEIDHEKSQRSDLRRGGKLIFLGYEFQCHRGSDGRLCVLTRQVDASEPRVGRGKERATFPRRPQKMRSQSRACTISRQPSPFAKFGAWLQDRLRSLSLAVWPAAAGDRGRWPSLAKLTRLRHIQITWREIPAGLGILVLAGFGLQTRTPLVGAIVCGAVTLALHWREVATAANWFVRRMGGMVNTLCAMLAVGCAIFLLSEVLSLVPAEEPTGGEQPGFYWGQHRSSLSADTLDYAIYLPPQLKQKSGPFPLIVFLHGFGERSKKRLLKVGLPEVIRTHAAMLDRFDMAAFFPIDPDGDWHPASARVEGAMAALDHVIAAHNLDASRVYLTGHSLGGAGVWKLAVAFPQRWAALVPVCSLKLPPVKQVSEIPCWIFQGDKDKKVQIRPVRSLVESLKAAGADVRYTEYSEEGHIIWHRAYSTPELYEWLAARRQTSFSARSR